MPPSKTPYYLNFVAAETSGTPLVAKSPVSGKIQRLLIHRGITAGDITIKRLTTGGNVTGLEYKVEERHGEIIFQDGPTVSPGSTVVVDAVGGGTKELRAVLEVEIPGYSATQPGEAFTFDAFSKINAERCEKAFGRKPSEWTDTQWITAIAGEVGETCNLIKKCFRGDFENRPGALDDTHKEIGFELADVFTYLDLYATSRGLKISRCFISTLDLICQIHDSTEPHPFSEDIAGLVHAENAATLYSSENPANITIDRLGARMIQSLSFLIDMDALPSHQQRQEEKIGSLLLDIAQLAVRLEINLTKSAVQKFNIVSRRHNCDILLPKTWISPDACCDNEQRTFEGGCTNCGAPAI